MGFDNKRKPEEKNCPQAGNRTTKDFSLNWHPDIWSKAFSICKNNKIMVYFFALAFQCYIVTNIRTKSNDTLCNKSIYISADLLNKQTS